MTDFSADRQEPPIRFRASAGQIGQSAGMQATRPRAERGPRAKRRSGQQQRGQVAHGGGALPQIPMVQGDNRHLLLAILHANAQNLGRDLPFGLWAQHNGYTSQIAPPGAEPYDWLEGH